MADRALTYCEKVGIKNQFSELVNKMQRHGLPDVVLLKKAFELASEKHGDTRRKNGEPFICHPLAVAGILAECGFESDLVAAALLHDLIEDCGVTRTELAEEFGAGIADIVEAVTNVNRTAVPDETVSILDLDDLSDVKFLTESSKFIKAVYIKCADRIHNLSTIEVFPEEMKKAKAEHTRRVIIPAAMKLGIHSFAGILGDLCFKIEDPVKYQEICDTYESVLFKNRYTLSGPRGLIEATKRVVMNDSPGNSTVARFEFVKRTPDSINRDLTNELAETYRGRKGAAGQSFPLFDVFFIVKSVYTESPENLFFSFYETLHAGPDRFTIKAWHKDGRDGFYMMEDKLGNLYRLFIQSEAGHRAYLYGQLLSLDPADDRACAGSLEGNKILVYKKDGSEMLIEEGATVLDFAFAIDPNVGICAKHAFLNNNKAQLPIYTVLRAGDRVEVVSDHDRDDQSNDKPHATVRWFEYLRTRTAIRDLSRWLERHMDSSDPPMLVFDENGVEYEIVMSATVLDFAFLVDETIGLHLKRAYINKSKTPCRLDTILRYRDRVRFEYDPSDTETPVFNWLSIVKTRSARDSLVNYFESKLFPNGNQDS